MGAKCPPLDKEGVRIVAADLVKLEAAISALQLLEEVGLEGDGWPDPPTPSPGQIVNSLLRHVAHHKRLLAAAPRQPAIRVTRERIYSYATALTHARVAQHSIGNAHIWGAEASVEVRAQLIALNAIEDLVQILERRVNR